MSRNIGTLIKYYQGYPPALIIAVAVHALIIYLLISGTWFKSNYVDIEKPVTISASVIKDNPQRRRYEQIRLQRAAQVEQQRREAAAAAKAREEAERQAREKAAAQKAAEEQARLEADARIRERQQQEEALARAKAEQERIDRERAEQQRLDQARLEQQRLEQENLARQQASLENQQVLQYTAIIHDAVTQNWLIPPSATNNMTVVLRLRLVPTGDVVAVNVIQSSGNQAFDSSAQEAVWRLGRFPELQEMPIALFEREFRTINLVFRPKGLLRED